MRNKTTFELTRRGFLGTTMGGAAVFAAGPSWGATKTLNVLSHKVHETVLGTGENDLLKAWKSSNDAAIAFTTFDSNPLQDRLFREASLTETDYGVGFMIDNRPTSEIASLFEPLDDRLKSDPIEDFGDIAPGLVQGMTVDGKLIGIPVRHATQGLFYNEALLEEAGISAPPKTLEELVEQSKKLDLHVQGGHAGHRHDPGERSRGLPGHVRARLRRRLHHQRFQAGSGPCRDRKSARYASGHVRGRSIAAKLRHDEE